MVWGVAISESRRRRAAMRESPPHILTARQVEAVGSIVQIDAHSSARDPASKPSDRSYLEYIYLYFEYDDFFHTSARSFFEAASPSAVTRSMHLAAAASAALVGARPTFTSASCERDARPPPQESSQRGNPRAPTWCARAVRLSKRSALSEKCVWRNEWGDDSRRESS